MKKKGIVIGITVCIIFLGIIGVLLYQENVKQKNIETQITRLTGKQKEFSTQTNRDEKKKLLEEILNERTDYDKSQKKYEKVSKKYSVIISDMRTDFISEYDQILKENTIENLDEINDITIIKEKKDKLDNLADMIDSENDYVFANAKDYQGYQSEIRELASAYTNRIGKIEEEQKKAEEEAKKKAEELKRRQKKRRQEKKQKRKKQKHIMRMNIFLLMFQNHGTTGPLRQEKIHVIIPALLEYTMQVLVQAVVELIYMS